MTTVAELITDSMLSINAIAGSEVPSAAESSAALRVLNDLIEEWNNERLLVYTINRSEFALVAGQQSYTIGAGGNFNTVRPIRIDSALIKVTSSTPNVELPLELLTVDQWMAITVKSVASTIPLRLYNTMAFPLSTIYLWPYPSVVSTLVLNVWNQITAFAAVTDTVTLPPAYLKALKLNLAMELTMQYGSQPGAVLVSRAAEAKATLKRTNTVPSFMATDAALLSNTRLWNYRTGE